MFFVIPEMPSKTFVMVLKNLPDHFKLIIPILQEWDVEVWTWAEEGVAAVCPADLTVPAAMDPAQSAGEDFNVTKYL